MVTAAVYQDLKGLDLQALLIYRYRADVRLFTSSYDFAESCVFNKQSLPPIIFDLYRYSLFQSYRVNLPSSFNIIILSTLVCSTCLPVSVLVRFYIF